MNLAVRVPIWAPREPKVPNKCFFVYLFTSSPLDMFTFWRFHLHPDTISPWTLFTFSLIHLFILSPFHICSPFNMIVFPPVHTFTFSPLHLWPFHLFHLFPFSHVHPFHLFTFHTFTLFTSSPFQIVHHFNCAVCLYGGAASRYSLEQQGEATKIIK